MVVVIKHDHIPIFLEHLVKTFNDFGLIFNSKKSAIVNIKNHKK